MGISENIKNIRTKVGMTQAQLAQAVKVNQSMIGLIETGRKIPSLMLTMDIAKALDCTMNDICREWGVKIMENTICKIFNNSEFGTLEVISIDGKDYFPAIDCAQRNFIEGESKWSNILKRLLVKKA